MGSGSSRLDIRCGDVRTVMEWNGNPEFEIHKQILELCLGQLFLSPREKPEH
jgi:hypothetical protein